MADFDFYWELAELNPDAVVFEEFEEAFLGVAHRNGFKPVAIYSMDFIVNIVAAEMLENNEFMKDLLDRDIIEEEDQVDEAMIQAKEYFEFNIANVGKGEGNEDAPIFLHSPQFDERGDDGQKI
jgi:hypothetical protein